MTEKRFEYIRGKYKHGIHDTVKDGEYRSGYRTTYDDFDLDKLTDELNIRENRIKQLENENEQLKQYIYDNLDEDICDVCSYQYLEKSQMDKYYVAKCKKGYDNCSKGTVIHCKDFKFKELQE